jgi:hypothetical protein
LICTWLNLQRQNPHIWRADYSVRKLLLCLQFAEFPLVPWPAVLFLTLRLLFRLFLLLGLFLLQILNFTWLTLVSPQVLICMRLPWRRLPPSIQPGSGYLMYSHNTIILLLLPCTSLLTLLLPPLDYRSKKMEIKSILFAYWYISRV